MSLASLFQLSRSGVLTKKKPAFHFDCAILFPFFVEDIEKKDFKKKKKKKKITAVLVHISNLEEDFFVSTLIHPARAHCACNVYANSSPGKSFTDCCTPVLAIVVAFSPAYEDVGRRLDEPIPASALFLF